MASSNLHLEKVRNNTSSKAHVISDFETTSLIKGGTVTAANSSFLSDGASACLLATEMKAKQLGLKPKTYLRQYAYASQDPKEELLLGPAYAIPRVLAKSGLKLSDFDVIELHEAFAGQVLCNLKALSSAKFCSEKLGLGEAVGAMDDGRQSLIFCRKSVSLSRNIDG